MFSALRTRYGIPGIIATVALVFAMTGGAFAAKYLITSTKQIKPSVLKKLKGKAGPAGPAGAAGAQGPAGPAGANGNDGAAGAAGKNGESVKLAAAGGECPEGGTKLTVGAESKAVCNGLEGEPGGPGSPWTAGGTLPPGATETGFWSGRTPFKEFGEEQMAISFPIPLAEELPQENVHAVTAEQWGSGVGVPDACIVDGIKGSGKEPRAQPGHLCIYHVQGVSEEDTNTKITMPNGERGAWPTGAKIRVIATLGGQLFTGTWAVTGKCPETEPAC